MFLGHPPAVLNLITLRCEAYIHIHRIDRKPKLFDHVECRVYIRIDEGLYKVSMPRIKRLVQTKYVTTNTQVFPMATPAVMMIDIEMDIDQRCNMNEKHKEP